MLILVGRQNSHFHMKDCMAVAVTLQMAVYHLHAEKTQTILKNAVSIPFTVSQDNGETKLHAIF